MTPIEIVARGLMAALPDNLQWEDYPEIGEYDWTAVVTEIRDLIGDGPPLAEFQAAYDELAGRAANIDP